MPKVDFESISRNLYGLFDNDKTEVKCIIEYLVVQLTAFQECLEKGTREEIRFKAHKLKGELSILGFEELSNHVAEIEASFFQDLQKLCDLDKFNHSTRTLLTVLNGHLQNT